MKILINTVSTKKSSGGAFQIAYNFVLKTLEHAEVEWCYVVSEDLDSVLPDEMKVRNYYMFPTQPDFKRTYKRVKRELALLEYSYKPDIVYSITAPSYFTFHTPEVMRFTNPLVVHPNKYSWQVQPFMSKFRLLVYCWNQRRMMRKAKFFVTQTETAKEGIVRITKVPGSHVKVIKNVLPSIFVNQDNSHISGDNGIINIACIAAPVPHKNLDILPEVLFELEKRGVTNVRFHVTIPETSPILRKIQNKLNIYKLDNDIINHGQCKQLDLVDVYRKCDFCFLPTLLEVFSVSTIEAMFFNLKIVATDFQFNREVLGNACLYYEPMNAVDAASKLAKLIKDKRLQSELSKKMKARMSLFDNYDNHFNSILQFLIDVASKKY